MGCNICKAKRIDVVDFNSKNNLKAYEEEANIKVAVRVRCMTENEAKNKENLIIEMNKDSLTVLNSQDKTAKHFNFDYCYWSIDGFEKQSNGYLAPLSNDESKYADQIKIYNDIGTIIKKEALKGFHSTLIAYGQTGSGKTYTLFGDDSNIGLIRRLCEDVCAHADAQPNIQIGFSMVEVYNEKLNDLLSDKTNLKIRESNTGFYIEDLAETMMTSQNYVTLVKTGMQKRITAETKMNENSSRSHVLATIKIIQNEEIIRKVSQINLVDLAGSEWNRKTDSSGQRFTEAKSINKSLLQLSICLYNLSDGKRYVPYRESALTKLLQNSLRNNGKTFMIATISPVESNYHETMSTLRYAERTKSIKVKARVNYENTKDYRIHVLERENKDLKIQIHKLFSRIPREILDEYLGGNNG